MTNDNANILPSKVIKYENSIPYIYIVSKDDVLNKKYIEIGIENDEECEVLTDIDKSARIVSSWEGDLQDGIKVRIKIGEK